MEDTIIAGEPGPRLTSEETERVLDNARRFRVITISPGRIFEYIDEAGNLVVPGTEEEQIAAWERLNDGTYQRWVEGLVEAMADAKEGRRPAKAPKTRRTDLSPFSSRRRR